MSVVISILVALIIAALILWAVRTLAPALGLPPIVVTVVTVIVVVLLVLWLVQVLLGAGVPAVDLD